MAFIANLRQDLNDDLELSDKLAEYSSQSNGLPVMSVVFIIVGNQGDCGKRIQLHSSYHYYIDVW